MKRIIDTIVIVIITFFITNAMQLGLDRLLQGQGTAEIGSAISVQGQTYAAVDISYFTEPLDNLTLSVPQSTDISRISSSAPVQIEEIINVTRTTDRKLILISRVEPNQTTQLLIPIATADEADLVRIVNAKEKGLVLEPVKDIQSFSRRDLTYAIITSLVYSFIIGLGSLWLDANHAKRTKSLLEESAKITKSVQEEAQKFEQQIKPLQEKVQETTQQLRGAQRDQRRIKILLMARLSDYSKELAFWRDTIRRILYQTTGDDKISEGVIDQVTKTLKTYTTLGKIDYPEDFETIKVLAKIIANSDRPQPETDE